MKRTELKRKTPLRSSAPNKARKPMKSKPVPSSKIRLSAQGKPCEVRLPGICNFDPETTVAAHLRIAGTCGTGMKPPDILTVRACSSCHDRIDSRSTQDGITQDELVRYVHEAHCRTLVRYLEEGLITMEGI